MKRSVGNDNDFGLLFYAQSDTEYIRFSLGSKDPPYTTRITHLHGLSGDELAVVVDDPPMIDGKWYHVKLVLEDNSVEAFVDGTLVAYAEDLPLSNGYIGLSADDPLVYFDDVVVREYCPYTTRITYLDGDNAEEFAVVVDDPTLIDDTWYDVRLELQGDSVEAFVDGTLAAYAEGLPLSNGYIGLSGDDPTVYFDDVVVTTTDTVEDILDFIDESIEEGTLQGTGPGKSAQNRLTALRNMIEAAGELITEGDLESARDQLLAAYRKCDGAPTPPDFVEGPAREELAELILALIENLASG
jgi:hypothetical protein